MLSGWEDVKPGAGRASAAPVWAEMGIHLEEDGKGGFHHKLLFPEQSSGLEGPLDRGGGSTPPGAKMHLLVSFFQCFLHLVSIRLSFYF